VFLVDRHQLSREAMRALLERDPRLQVVGEAETAAEVIGQTSAARPDILVAACHIEADRHGVMVSARTACPEILLVLTSHLGRRRRACGRRRRFVFTDVSSEVVEGDRHRLRRGDAQRPTCARR
jgi:DNA-binding NarL/FixJ family response regulator